MFEKYNEIKARREEGEQGFTLIELLVVVVIIGILVAIAIPLYLNYKQGAANKSLASDVRNAAPTVEQYFADNNAYPTDGADLTAAPYNAHVGDNTTLTYNAVGATGYCIQGVSSDASVHYHYASADGKTQTGDC